MKTTDESSRHALRLGICKASFPVEKIGYHAKMSYLCTIAAARTENRAAARPQR
ncbi:hypothetical protein [uncultured Alistipes sp.]|uniref:hypothetical protein n=1 Tax=uncultured Alistipes sp. TaxID=538949 RepID=UPI0025D536DF|nr:hypothetical protein [uncultured Alistipes sp.]